MESENVSGEVRHGSLFNGIGGFQLAAQWMGWENVFSCEIDDFCNKVTKHHFPDCIQHGDIKTTDFTIYRGAVDLITGGFPCQPYSSAGKRLGKEDDRHLWPEMLRAIREVQPSYVVGENVRGITNWNGGVVFDEVQADLEAEGYEVLPFLLPACAVNAPHRRDRIWFVAHAICEGTWGQSGAVGYKGRGTSKDWKKGVRQDYGKTGTSRLNATGENGAITYSGGVNCDIPIQQWGQDTPEDVDVIREVSSRITTNTKIRRLSQRNAEQLGKPKSNKNDKQLGRIPEWGNFPTQSPLRIRDDGLSSRLDGITFPKWCSKSISSGGNAIVPQVAYEIFKAIQMMKP